MNWVLIGMPALAIVGIGICGPTQALPAMRPAAVLVAVRSVALLPAAYRRHYRYRHSGDPAPAGADPGEVKPGQNAPPEAVANAASGSSAQWIDPPAASGGAKLPAPSGVANPTAAPPQEAAAATPAEARPPPPIGYAQHRRRHYRRYYGNGGGTWPGGGLGIRLPFLGGL